MSTKTRLFLVLFAAGFLGITSFLLLDFKALIEMLPLPPGEEPPPIDVWLKLLSLVQPTVFLALAVWGGLALAPRVGLSAPAFAAWAGRRPPVPVLLPQVLPGLLGGIAAGLAIVAIAATLNPLLPPGAAARISAFGGLMPLTTRLLYGGITEELLLRWGLMSLLAWAGWRLFRKTRPQAPASCFHAAIFLSALIFGAGHLPAAFFVVPEPNAALVAFVLAANGAFGVVGGYLFWRRGLESAIIAHMATHLVLFGASRLGAYF